MIKRLLVGTILTGVLSATAARAQQPAENDSADLAKQLSNPIASLVSVPFQFNWEQNVGPSELTRFILNVQPVMPFTVNEDVNLIVRIVAPLVSQPPLCRGWSGHLRDRRHHDVLLGVSIEVEAIDLGRRPGDRAPVHQRAGTRFWKMEHWPNHRRVEAGRPVDRRRTLESGVVLLRGCDAVRRQRRCFSSRSLPTRRPIRSRSACSRKRPRTGRWTTGDGRSRSTSACPNSPRSGTFPGKLSTGILACCPVHPEIGPSWKIRPAIVLLLPRAKRQG